MIIVYKCKNLIQISTIIKWQKKKGWCCCLLIILLNYVYRRTKNYYSQVFLEEYKYVVKENKNSIKNFITDDIEISSEDSDKENSDKENCDKET